MSEPLVTVIVPVYNTEKYFADCVDSFLAQTYEAPEILLVDDGSSDGSPALCDVALDARDIVHAVKGFGLLYVSFNNRKRIVPCSSAEVELRASK